jgi:hypothetical protein
MVVMILKQITMIQVLMAARMIQVILVAVSILNVVQILML